MVDIFISYSHDDMAVMRRLRRDLGRVGFGVWTDEGITPGTQNWKLEVEKAIRSCSCVIVLFSPEAARSRWVRAEIDFAETQRKAMFPVLVRGDEADALPFGFAGYQHVDLREAGEYVAGVNRLVAGISGYLSTRQPAPPPAGDDAAATVSRVMAVGVRAPRHLTLPLVLALTVVIVALVWLVLLATGVLPPGATPFSNPPG